MKNTSPSTTTEYETSLHQLREELQLREYEIALLKETTDAVTSQLILDKLFQLVVERVHTLIGAETVILTLLDKDCKNYTYRATYGKNAEEILGESLPLDFGVCGWVWRHKRPWWKGVLQELKEEERNKWENEAGTVIMVPLIGKHHFLGGLGGINKIGGDEFDQRDLDMLSIFASQVSIAIENATAFDELEQSKIQAEAYQVELKKLNTELLATNRELKNLALYDHLTGLPNRVLLRDRLQQNIYSAKREQDTVAILMIDLDHFKEINDTLGHNIGDDLLKQVSHRFDSQLRRSDTVGRLGGDEFAIIVPGADIDSAVQVAIMMIKCLEPPFEVGDNILSVSGSVGITVYPEHGDDVSELFKRADVAMYVAKRGNHGYTIYDPVKDQHSASKLSLRRDLRSAVNNGELELYYQPRVDLQSSTIIGVEALARWQHPEHGFIPPDQFIPIMEQTGLIRPFTHWVLDAALKQCSAWSSAGIDISMSVNLSMHNLREPLLPRQILRLLEKWELKHSALILELTESAVMSDSQKVHNMLEELASAGVQFSIDDFGTGYSSLSYLKKLPVHELKIDKSFVMEMDTNKDDVVIVRSTIELAHNLGLRVIAEGVENEQVMEMLIAQGCDEIQGYFISCPVPADEIVKLFHKMNDDIKQRHTPA